MEVGEHRGSALSSFLFVMVIESLRNEARQKSLWTMMFVEGIVISSEGRERDGKSREVEVCPGENRIEGRQSKEVKKSWRCLCETVDMMTRQEDELDGSMDFINITAMSCLQH